MTNGKYDFNALENATVFDIENKKLGNVAQIYLSDASGQPEFVTVNLGFFGTRETFIPVDAVRRTEEGLQVPFTKDYVKGAPQVEADGSITVREEQELLNYYSSSRNATPNPQPVDRAPRQEASPADHAGAAGTSDGTTGDGEMIAREERLNIGKQTQEAGRARLRKRVRTETEHVEVPVQREELVIEREGIDPDSAEARNSGNISESANSEEVITLREERAVVDKETVATEKVNIGKRTVTNTESVDAKVRKEEIEIDEADPGRR